MGGLHAFMGWDGPIMTDSGGFQVFSLGASLAQGVGKIGGLMRVGLNIEKHLLAEVRVETVVVGADVEPAVPAYGALADVTVLTEHEFITAGIPTIA